MIASPGTVPLQRMAAEISPMSLPTRVICNIVIKLNGLVSMRSRLLFYLRENLTLRVKNAVNITHESQISRGDFG